MDSSNMIWVLNDAFGLFLCTVLTYLCHDNIKNDANFFQRRCKMLPQSVHDIEVRFHVYSGSMLENKDLDLKKSKRLRRKSF